MFNLSEYLSNKKKTIKDDLIAGLIVAIIALPLAIGFAIASNCTPAMGVYTAIIAGLVAAIFGGSEFQVSGPTGAMVVVILSVVNAHGISGLILATFVAGVILLLMGILKFGKIIEYIPSPVIVGFTAGIGIIIFFGQLNNFFGLDPIYPKGAEFFDKTIISLIGVQYSNVPTLILSVLSLLILIYLPKISKKIPGSICAVILSTILVLFNPYFFNVKTVKDIGQIPTWFPAPQIPELSISLILAVMPAALTIAALAAIESLLSAVVADGLTGQKHNPNKELIGQGLANVFTSFFGGMPATGAIARTATNIRSGAKSKFASMFHAIFLLIFIILFANIIGYIPLATLAAILMFVAFRMIEWERIAFIFRLPLSDVAVMVVTFLLTIFVDLTTAIEFGLVLAALLFMKRISDLYNVEEFESKNDPKSHKLINFSHKDITIYTMHGPLFFGAASRFEQAVSKTLGKSKPIKIIRMEHVPVIDATGIYFLESTSLKHKKNNGLVLFTCVHPDVMKIIKKSHVDKIIGENCFFNSTEEALIFALKHSHKLSKEPEELTENDKYILTQDLGFKEEIIDKSTKDSDPVEAIFHEYKIDLVMDGIKTSVDKIIDVSHILEEEGIENIQKGVKNIQTISKKITSEIPKNVKKIQKISEKITSKIPHPVKKNKKKK